jgi:hypothetical protein
MKCMTAALLLTLGLRSLTPERPAWEVVRSEDGDFAFSMPFKPTQKTDHEGLPGGAVESLSYSGERSGSGYLLRRTRYAQPVQPRQVIARLAQVRTSDLTETARLVKETPIVVDGVIGHDFTYVVPSPRGDGDVTRRTRHFLKDQFYYELTVTSSPGRPLPDDTTRFLSSLTFEALVKASYALAGRRSNVPAQHRIDSPQDAPPSEGKLGASKPPVTLVDSTPEDALKTFLIALAAQDEATLRAVTLPDDEFDWLLKDRPPPQTAGALAKMKAKLEQTPFRRLAAGDRVKMPGGRIGVIKPVDVENGRVVLLPEGAALPARLENVGGHWKVLARTFIAARKSAESAGRRGLSNRPRGTRRPGR